MRTVVTALRLVVAIAIVIAVVAQLVRAMASPAFLVWNFFGYFTIQSNLIACVALLTTVVVTAGGARRAPTGRVVLLRAAATVYMATTGVVYNTLLVHAALDDAFTVQWSNDVLHRWVPLWMVLDWLLVADRGRLRMRQVWWFLAYPAVWLVVVLVRGATDGWVPYPFLDPGLGYGVVAAYCVGVAVFIALMGVVVVWMSRLRVLRV